MNLAIIKKNFDENGGGAERYAAAVAAGLSKRGHSIAVLSEKFVQPKTAEIRFVKVQRSVFRGFSRTSNFHRSVQKSLKNLDYDLSYALSRSFPTDIFRVSEQIHAVWAETGLSPAERLNPRHLELLSIEHQIFSPENTKALVCNSELTKKQIAERFKYPDEQIFHIRNGVDRSKFYPAGQAEICEIRRKLNLEGGRAVLLFPAGNFKIKGISSIVRTIRSLPPELRDEILVLAIGGDIDKSQLSLFEKNGLENLFRYDGRVKNMRDYYLASDLLFYPSVYEPFGNVCLEAAACGVPSLTTELNGSSELVDHGKSGFLVADAGRSDEMAKHISAFISMDKDKKMDFSRAAYKASLPYDWDRHMDELEALFRRLSIQRSQIMSPR